MANTTTIEDPNEEGKEKVRLTKAILEETYMYQNSKTGAVSAAPLTIRQLCRILCPAQGVVTAHITPDTQVLRVINSSYDGSWEVAKSLPVLQQACAEWHYVEEGKTLGPVSCRSLAGLLSSDQVSKATQVWSSTGSNGKWSSIHEVPHLMPALEAFRDSQMAAGNAADQPTTYASQDMTFSESNGEPAAGASKGELNQNEKDVQAELDAFLSSTGHMDGPQQAEREEEGYQSDGGTQYVKDPVTGNWIHEALAAASVKRGAPEKAKSETSSVQAQKPSKKRKKPKFSAKNAKNWIYATGLPEDATLDEVSVFFSKVGIIELDPETQRPKIKLYRHKEEGSKQDKLKGDASICYARPESVELALQLLDEAPFRPSIHSTDNVPVRVQRAKFEQHGDKFDEKKNRISNAKRKVAKLAALQAVGWDEGDNGRITGGRKGLCIVVLKHMFALSDLLSDEDAELAKLEQEVRKTCEEWGTVEKITVFSKNPAGVVIVKFAQPTAASTAVTEYDGRERKGQRVEATFWDGVTDYTVRNEEHEKKETETRLNEFGSWLDSQEVPEEFQLQVEGS